MSAKTIFEKIWESHVVKTIQDGPDVLYIDKHLIHEVTTPQAFEGIKKRNIPIFRKENILATTDHNIPTKDQHLPIKEALSRKQVEALRNNCKEHDIELFDLGHKNQGIIHVIGPQLGVTQPGRTIVCGDSHTSTHGALGAIAFGIGTSEVEQVFATQCVLQPRPKSMRVEVNGTLSAGVTSKDIILHIISKISTSGGTGYFVEYCGTAVEKLSMEARMTICNMSIEMGARGGIIAPDQITFDYLEGREFSPKGDKWDSEVTRWKALCTDKGATYDKTHIFKAEDIEPYITYGTNPSMGIGITGNVPTLEAISDKGERAAMEKALDYMALEGGQALIGKKVDYVFIGSCTNSRIEDLRA
ncbi:MAG: 3-isopropylmalate dehydratase large subunit, partial [Flavobacteriales bacterium]|nr:3-isopropylmalate dehydratase large subunit [Flavobacteriales bacterium]